MARVCTAGLADVSLQSGPDGPEVQLASDDPVRACLASQYAGWQIKAEQVLRHGLRADAGGRRPRGDLRAHPRQGAAAVSPSACSKPASTRPRRSSPTSSNHLPATAEKLTLLVAPASSMAGTVQVVARSLETALHKLHELKFDLRQVVSGYGVAPLPPVAADEGRAIGWTNDAILYGGRVVLWVRADDEVLDQRRPEGAVERLARPRGAVRRRSSSGTAATSTRSTRMLFSPADGRVPQPEDREGATAFGRTEPDLLRRSFGG